MSKYNPISDEDFNSRSTLPMGWYPAEISDAEDGCVEKLSANGNLMFVTKFKVFSQDGKQRTIIDYVMADGKAAFKLRACAEAFGLLDVYKTGNLTEEDLKGRSGYIKLNIDAEGRNIIQGYKSSMPGTLSVKDLPKVKPMTKKQTEDDLNDSVPF